MSSFANLASAFGRDYALISAIGATVLAVILLVVGTYEIVDVSSKFSARTTATIEQTQPNNLVVYTYTVDNVGYKGQGTTDQPMQVGEKLPIYYNPKSPGESILGQLPPNYFGYALFLGAGLILGFSWLIYYLTTRSKGFAIGEGAVAVAKAL
jgi:hypothetical protein